MKNNNYLKATILAANIINKYNHLPDDLQNNLQKKIIESSKPIRELATMLINEYGHDNFIKLYSSDSETYNLAFELCIKNIKLS